MTKPFPQESLQHDIEKRAKVSFEQALLGWAEPMRLDPDQIGIDYYVQLLERTEPETNAVGRGDFLVQLKGDSNAEYAEHALVYDIETKYLKFYYEQKRRPVFLVVIDIETGKGFWLFTQQHVVDKLCGVNWTSQGTVRLHIPKSQAIEDKAAFGKAVRDADIWIRRLWPGTLNDILFDAKTKLENRDPRVQIDLSKSTAHTQLEIGAKEPISGSIRLIGPDEAVMKAMRDFEIGREVKASDYGIKIEVKGLPGSPDTSENIEAMHAGNVLAATVTVSGLRKDGTAAGSVDLHGQVRLSRMGFFLTAALTSRLLTFEAEGVLDSKGVAVNTDYRISIEPWIGKSVNLLPDFDRVRNAFGSPELLHTIKIEMFMDGNSLGTSVIRPDDQPQLTILATYTHYLAKARHVARMTGSPLALGAPLTEDGVYEIDRCFAFLNGERIPIGINDATFVVTTSKEKLTELKAVPGSQFFEDLSLPGPEYKHMILGTEVNLGAAVVRCDRAAVEFVGPVTEGADGQVSSKWRLRPVTECFVQQVDLTKIAESTMHMAARAPGGVTNPTPPSSR